MSKQDKDGNWEHRIWCNFFSRPGPCTCCDRHPEWPYLSDLRSKNPQMDDKQIVMREAETKWPEAVFYPNGPKK